MGSGEETDLLIASVDTMLQITILREQNGSQYRDSYATDKSRRPLNHVIPSPLGS